MAEIIYGRKTSDETKNFTCDLAPFLGSTETISGNGTCTCDPGITIASNTIVGSAGNYHAIIEIAGGTINNVYNAYLLVTTSVGQVLKCIVRVTITG